MKSKETGKIEKSKVAKKRKKVGKREKKSRNLSYLELFLLGNYTRLFVFPLYEFEICS